MNYDTTLLKELTEEIYPEAVAFRRRLHMNPELSEHEVQTAAAICERLDSMGIEYTSELAGHGISAVIYGKNREHGVGIRADMDALPLSEEVDVPFKSQNPEVMHACGHDIHTAILLGTASVLNSIKDILPGSVRLFFQPSEETVGGARQMIESGCMKLPRIESVIGLHVDTDIDVGKAEFIPGYMNAASTEFSVTVTGKSCHGAHPTDGIDALLPACAMVTALQSIITRRIDATKAALITVGAFRSGTKGNIVSGEAVFSGIIRSFETEIITSLKENLRTLCESVAQAYGAECQVNFTDSYPSLRNDDFLLNLSVAASKSVLGENNVEISEKRSLGADDFAYFCHSSRGLYYNIGARHLGEKNAYPIHSNRFNPDEGCIRVGILSETAAVLKILEEESKTW